MKRFLIVSSIVFAILIVVYGVIWSVQSYLFYALTRLDPYPAFMTDSQLSDIRSYQELERKFSEFVVRTFPIGSNAKDAILQITREGFQVTNSTPDSVVLHWNRAAGPCSEHYLIVINRNADGVIVKTTGSLRPICL
jgi:hypothetical protein